MQVGHNQRTCKAPEVPLTVGNGLAPLEMGIGAGHVSPAPLMDDAMRKRAEKARAVAMRRRKAMQEETPEQAQARRQAAAMAMAKRRTKLKEGESPEQFSERKKANAQSMSSRRRERIARETAEEAAARRKRSAELMAARRKRIQESETPEQVKARRAAQAAAKARLRAKKREQEAQRQANPRKLAAADAKRRLKRKADEVGDTMGPGPVVGDSVALPAEDLSAVVHAAAVATTYNVPAVQLTVVDAPAAVEVVPASALGPPALPAPEGPLDKEDEHPREATLAPGPVLNSSAVTAFVPVSVADVTKV